MEPKRTKLLQEAVQFSPLTNCIYTCQLEHLGHFSFVRIDWRGHSHRNESLTFNQNYRTRSTKSYIQLVVCKGDGFSSKTREKAYFIVTMTGLALICQASSDFGKHPFLIQPTDITSPELRLFLKPRVQFTNMQNLYCSIIMFL